MDRLGISDVIAVLPVKNMETAVGWYSRLFGREPDASPMPSLAQWAFAGDRTLQVTLGESRAGGGMANLVVDEIEQLKTTLASNDIAFEFDDKQSKFVKFGTLQDPDGNEITVLQPKAD